MKYCLAICLALVCCRADAQMLSDPSIPNTLLPFSGSELLYVQQKGISTKTTVTNLATGLLSPALLVKFNPAITAGIVAPNYGIQISTDTSFSPALIWGFSCGGCTVKPFDNIASVVHVPSGTSVTNVNGVASYLVDDNPSPSGFSGNAVNFFSVAIANTTNARVWGTNPVVTDTETGVVGTLTGIHLIGSESDVNVYSPGTIASGFIAVGDSASQPLGSFAFLAGQLDFTGANRAEWGSAFISANGCCQLGLVVGVSGSGVGNSLAGQPNYFYATSSTGVAGAWTLTAFPTLFQFAHTFTGTLPLGTWAFDGGILFNPGTNVGVSIAYFGDHMVDIDGTHDVIVGNSNLSAVQIGNMSTPYPIKLQDTSLTFLGANDWTANGTVGTALTSLGPAGSHTTVQTWFTVKDSGGVVRYLPAF